MSVQAEQYEGAKPYVFISYSHADSERILSIVEKMKEYGYRVWYDANMEAGKQWTAELADRIAACEIFMPFISRAFADSEHCMQEIRHAKSENRRSVPVKLNLDRSQYPKELKFLLENAQGFSADNFPDAEAFAARLNGEPSFRRCRRATANAVAPLAEVVTRERPVAPSAAFVGRAEKMREIENAFRDGETAVILYGMGGIGKSEICRKLFRDAGTRLAKRIGWATWRGSLRETFYGQFPGIRERNAEIYWAQAREYLKTQGRDLLAFLDNADNLTETDAAELTKLGCRFLITSRKRSGRIRSIAAGTLTPEQCRVLYRRALYEDDACTDDAPDAVLDEILRLAAGHTLSVQLLAKTQRAAGIDTAELLAQLRKSGFDLGGVAEEITYLHNPERKDADADEEAVFIDHMSRIFDLSKLREMKKGADALRALQGMSLLAPNAPIAVRTVKKWLGLPDLNGLNRAADAGWLNETFENGVRAVSIHPVIAAVVRHTAMPDEALIDALAGRLRLDMIPEKTEVFTNRLPVLEHAVALDKAAGVLHSANYGLMLGQMGYLLLQQADYDNALSYLKKGAEIEKETLGEDHPEMATVYDSMGFVCSMRGDCADALTWYQKALRIREKALESGHPHTAISYNNIGAVYENQGNYVSALEYYQKALRIKEKALGSDHPSTAISYGNIGLVYNERGNYAKGLEYYQKALRIQEKALGGNHPDTATTYHNIGTALFAQGDYGEALKWLEKALAVFLKVLGEKHPATEITREWVYETKRRLSNEE